MELTKDSLIIGHWDDAPVRIHWTVILCALLFGEFNFQPGFWIAFVFLVFVHEAGHALIVRHYNLCVDEIVVHGAGGYCMWTGETDEMQRSVIAWGGVLAQFILFIIAKISIVILGYPKNSFFYQVYHVFLNTNLFIMLFNLIPVPPLDGVHAWKIINPFRDLIIIKLNKIKHIQQDRQVRKQLKRIMEVKADSDFDQQSGNKED